MKKIGIAVFILLIISLITFYVIYNKNIDTTITLVRNSNNIDSKTELALETPCTKEDNIDSKIAGNEQEYTNQKFGIKMLVPYSNLWLDNKYKINPVDLLGNSIFFGMPVCSSAYTNGGVGYKWTRTMRIDIVPYKSLEQAFKSYNDTNLNMEIKRMVSKDNTGNVDYITADTSEGCTGITKEIIGKNYNFIISKISDGAVGVCSSPYNQDQISIDKLVASFKLI
jgi:hypothetical protein